MSEPIFFDGPEQFRAWLAEHHATESEVWVGKRFTPRKRSNWSTVNIANVGRLEREGLMHPAGRAAFAQRSEARSGIYAFERETPAAFTSEQEARLRRLRQFARG